MYRLTNPDGKIMATGTEEHCLIRLQKLQPFSCDMALKHQGWSIEKIED